MGLGVLLRRNYNRVYLHFIWATWDRLPFLTPEVRALVYPPILAECAEQKCRVEALGGVEDHVHLVVHFSATASIAGFMKAVKGASSRLVTQKMPSLFFKWQGAYGVESVEPEGLPVVIQYVQDQENRHRERQLDIRWETIDIHEP